MKLKTETHLISGTPENFDDLYTFYTARGFRPASEAPVRTVRTVSPYMLNGVETTEHVVYTQHLNRDIHDIEQLMEKLARKYHDGQFRRDGVTPYITHVEDVVSRLNDPVARAIGWGHDLIEDRRVTAKDLLADGVPMFIINSLQHLNFPSGLTVDQYHERVFRIAHIEHVNEVKLSDNMSNISDKPSLRQIEKYIGSIDILLSNLLPAYDGNHRLAIRKHNKIQR
jgi:hypothetical protein